MKTLYTFFFCLILFSVNVYSQLLPNDLLVNIENEPSTFVQKNPVIFPNGTNGYISVWEDYRTGERSYFAQAFDSNSLRLGNNFPVLSNFELTFSNSGSFLNLGERSISHPIFEMTYVLEGSFYNEQRSFIEKKLLYSETYPWCGTGWYGIQNNLLSYNNNYFLFHKYGELLTVRKYDVVGNNIGGDYPVEIFDRNTVQISSAINRNGKIFLAWMNLDLYFPDTLKTYAVILDSAFNFVSDTILIKTHTEGNYNPQPQNNWKTIVVSDSLFEFFRLDKDSLKLEYSIFDEFGNMVLEEQQINLAPDFLSGPIEDINLQSFTHTPIVNDGFEIIISLRKFIDFNVPFKYYNLKYSFNAEGIYLNEEIIDSSFLPRLGNSVFKTSEDEYYFPYEKHNDVYSVFHNNFLPQDSIKLNDDEIGSNEIYPSVYYSGSVENMESYFFCWRDEIGTWGRRYKGNQLSEEYNLKSADLQFFSDGTSINFWSSEQNNGKFNIGITKLDENLNELQSIIIDSNNLYKARYAKLSIDDSTIIIGFINSSNIFIEKFDSDCNLIKKDTAITNAAIGYSLKIWEDENSFWINWADRIMKFDNNLNPLSEQFQIEYNPLLYLGDSLFLYRRSHDFDLNVYGTIKNIHGETIVDDFVLAPHVNEVKSVMLNYNEFLVTYHHNKNYYFKVFDRLGNLKISQTQINDNLDQFTKYGTFTINDNDVVFVWSDSRNEQKGYDIFAKSIKKNTITAINEMEGEVYPSNFSLSQNYPNPFNPTTKIKFSTSPFNPSPYQGEGNRERLVTLKVYDILGNEIATLVDEKKPPGNYEVEFDAGGLASGTYIYQLKAGEFTKAKKLLLLK